MTTHEAIARDRMLGVFRRSPNLRALVQIRARRWQEVEDAAWEVADAVLSIDDSIGVALDAIGRLVGRGRDGASDAVYRIALKAQIRINRSGARPADARDVVSLSTGSAIELRFFGGAYTITHTDPLPLDGAAEAVARSLEQIRPLGANGRLRTVQTASGARWSSRGLATVAGVFDSRGAPAAVGSTWAHGRAL